SAEFAAARAAGSSGAAAMSVDVSIRCGAESGGARWRCEGEILGRVQVRIFGGADGRSREFERHGAVYVVGFYAGGGCRAGDVRYGFGVEFDPSVWRSGICSGADPGAELWGEGVALVAGFGQYGGL